MKGRGTRRFSCNVVYGEREVLRLERLPWSLAPCASPVGEPYAGNPHVRFDERGCETCRCRMAQATAPILDSPLSHIAFPTACPQPEEADMRASGRDSGYDPNRTLRLDSEQFRSAQRL